MAAFTESSQRALLLSAGQGGAALQPELGRTGDRTEAEGGRRTHGWSAYVRLGFILFSFIFSNMFISGINSFLRCSQNENNGRF